MSAMIDAATLIGSFFAADWGDVGTIRNIAELPLQGYLTLAQRHQPKKSYREPGDFKNFDASVDDCRSTSSPRSGPAAGPPASGASGHRERVSAFKFMAMAPAGV